MGTKATRLGPSSPTGFTAADKCLLALKTEGTHRKRKTNEEVSSLFKKSVAEVKQENACENTALCVWLTVINIRYQQLM